MESNVNREIHSTGTMSLVFTRNTTIRGSINRKRRISPNPPYVTMSTASDSGERGDTHLLIIAASL